MDIKEIREILKLVERYGVQDFTLQRGDTRIRVRKGGVLEETAVGRTRELPFQEASARPAQAAPGDVPAAAGDTLAVGVNQFLVTSPIVGTFYRAPGPESPPYVEVGTNVSKGTVMCIVEAMKIMNEIECEVSGKVSSILVENAQPVEYGQPLFIVDLS
ncbi:MAG: acetyl-CoA carboxylase biotin carboxyl carrier protein [bacterium]|nr:acetyl-CoA carboxylase biotin carboxyl carrier protein [bacterium]MDT8396243.1 acetyl-CoA carboxylase biotin carboxyl carrier protein [bacterium]